MGTFSAGGCRSLEDKVMTMSMEVDSRIPRVFCLDCGSSVCVR